MQNSRIKIEQPNMAQVVHAPLHLARVACHSTLMQAACRSTSTLMQMAMLVTSCGRWASSGNTSGKWDSRSNSRSVPASTQSFKTGPLRRHVVIQAARMPNAISNEGFRRTCEE